MSLEKLYTRHWNELFQSNNVVGGHLILERWCLYSNKEDYSIYLERQYFDFLGSIFGIFDY